MEETARLAGYRQASSYQRYEDPQEFTKKWLPMDVAERLLKAFVGKGYPPISSEDVMALTSPVALTYASRQVRNDSATHTAKTSVAHGHTFFTLTSYGKNVWCSPFSAGAAHVRRRNRSDP